jgi:hypothetical protein
MLSQETREPQRVHHEPHSPLAWRRFATAASVTFSGRQVIIGVTDTSAPRTITLATSLMNDSPNARMIVVKDEGGTANVGNITIATEGSETIEGSASILINVPYGMAMLYSDGAGWFIL